MLLSKQFLGFWDTRNSDLMSFCWSDLILTLNPYYLKSKMAAIAFLNTFFIIWVNCAALYTASGIGAVKSLHTACQCQECTLDSWDLKSKMATIGNFEYISR